MVVIRTSIPSCLERRKEKSKLQKDDGTGEHYWDNLASHYDSLYENEWCLFENAVLKQDLNRLVAKAIGNRLLDIGCGTGLGYDLLGGPTANIDYVGVDISGAMLREFGKRHRTAKMIHASGDTISTLFSPCQFEMVIAINVSASFPPNTRRMLETIFRVLVPGGLIYLSFLNRYSLRRIVHGLLETREEYRTRSDNHSLEFAWAEAFSGRQLISMGNGVGFRSLEYCYRSVLGGVWESATSVRVERVLARVVPWLGHSIVLMGTRAAAR